MGHIPIPCMGILYRNPYLLSRGFGSEPVGAFLAHPAGFLRAEVRVLKFRAAGRFWASRRLKGGVTCSALGMDELPQRFDVLDERLNLLVGKLLPEILGHYPGRESLHDLRVGIHDGLPQVGLVYLHRRAVREGFLLAK